MLAVLIVCQLKQTVCRQHQTQQVSVDPEERARLAAELRKAEEASASLQGQCRNLQQQVCSLSMNGIRTAHAPVSC